MYMLIAGLALWYGAHLFKRVAPGVRASMGSAGRGVVAVGVLAGLALMILGYRGAELTPIWSPPLWATHLNNLLMLIAVFTFGMSATTGRLRGKLRHPMLLSVVIWAVAHLLVNGDLASVVLFGGMLIWALLEMAVINRAEVWDRPEPGSARKDILLIVITLVIYAIAIAIHLWLGVRPFPV